jgi:hypothetical protein
VVKLRSECSVLEDRRNVDRKHPSGSATVEMKAPTDKGRDLSWIGQYVFPSNARMQ